MDFTRIVATVCQFQEGHEAIFSIAPSVKVAIGRFSKLYVIQITMDDLL